MKMLTLGSSWPKVAQLRGVRESGVLGNPMKKLLASLLCVTLILAMPQSSLGALQTGQIAGKATVDGRPLANVTVRLRNVDTGQLVGTTTANAQGDFSFSSLGAGNFIVETVGFDGNVLGTSTVVGLSVATMVAINVIVNTTTTALAAAGGAIGAVGAVGAAAGAAVAAAAAPAIGAVALITSTAGVVILGGAAIGAAAVVVATNDASPSQ